MPLPPDGSDVVFKLQPGASITGDVVFDGTSTPGSAAVVIRPVEGTGASPTPSTRASADGQFVIANLFGPMLIRVDAVPGWSLKSVLYGGRDIIDEPTDFVSGAKIRVVLGNRMGAPRRRHHRREAGARQRRRAARRTPVAMARARVDDEKRDRRLGRVVSNRRIARRRLPGDALPRGIASFRRRSQTRRQVSTSSWRRAAFRSKSATASPRASTCS